MRGRPIGQEFEFQTYEGLKSKFMITKIIVTLDDMIFLYSIHLGLIRFWLIMCSTIMFPLVFTSRMLHAWS